MILRYLVIDSCEMGVRYPNGPFKQTLTKQKGSERISDLDWKSTDINIQSHIITLFFKLTGIWIGLTIINLGMELRT